MSSLFKNEIKSETVHKMCTNLISYNLVDMEQENTQKMPFYL